MSVSVYSPEGLKRINQAFEMECAVFKLLDSSNNVVSNTINLGLHSMRRVDDSPGSVDDTFKVNGGLPVDFDIDITGSSKTVYKIRGYTPDELEIEFEAVFDSPTVFSVSGTYQVQTAYVKF